MTEMNKATDEEIIFSESVVTIQGEAITVNEITYVQGLRLNAAIRPMIDDMVALFAQREREADFEQMQDVFATHADIVNRMMMLATGKDQDFIDSLKDDEGQLLLMTFWQVNAGFFTRRLVSRAIQKMQAEDRASQSNTAKSSVN